MGLDCSLGNITTDGLYISPSFMDKLVVHLCKNFMKLPNIKVPLILGIWGGKGQGKSFQVSMQYLLAGSQSREAYNSLALSQLS